MHNGHLILQRARFYGSVASIYLATLLFALYIFHPFPFFQPAVSRKLVYSQYVLPDATPIKITAGRPVRIVIVEPDNGLNIDLIVEKGDYNETAQSWSLSQVNAQFALPSELANDHKGTTLIYGHNNKFVFGYLSSLHVGTGAFARVYTDNGHVFRYSYENTKNVKPDDLSVFDDQGSPALVVQTCSGSWFETRGMYQFKLEKLES